MSKHQKFQWPPDGWFPFGSHVEFGGTLEFSKEVGEDGMPLWERHVPMTDTEKNLSDELLLTKMENDRLHKLVAKAPHAISCKSAYGVLPERCDCWKQRI